MRRWRLAVATLAILVLWQLASWGLSNRALPGPVQVMLAWPFAVKTGLLAHLLASAGRVLAATGVAVVLAYPIGLLLGLSRFWAAFIDPMVHALYPIPKVVLLPVVIVILGAGEAAKICILVAILVFQLVIVVRDSARGVREELVFSVRAMGASRLGLLRYVYLPATLPAVITALRVAVGTAVAVLFFAESFGTTRGLGFYIMVQTWGRFAYPEMYLGIVAMGLLGLGLYESLALVERWLCPWQISERGEWGGGI